MNDVPKKETIMKVTRKKLMAAPMGCYAMFNFHPLKAMSCQKTGFFKRPAMRLFCLSIALGLTVWASGLAVAAQPYKMSVEGNVNITGAYHVNGAPISATSNWSQAGSDISYTTGNVGIGTTTPQTKFHAVGTSWFQGDNTPLPTAAGKGIAIGSGRYFDYFGYLFAFDYGTSTPQTLLLNHPGGNVGIGTLLPLGGRLHVDGGSDTGVYGFSSSSYGLFGDSDSGSFAGVYGRSSNVGVLGYSAGGYGVYGKSDSGYAGYFQGKVTVTGNVGIGTTTPQTRLHAVGTSWFQGDNTPLPAAAGKGVAIGSGGNFGYLFAYDYGNNTPQSLLLNSPGGNVGIGTLNPIVRLHVESGYVDPLYTAVKINGSVWATGIVTWDSDVRLKQGVHDLRYGLRDIMQLRPVSYTWKQASDGPVQLGLLAQEVEAVVPELVTTAHDVDRTKGINYIGLLPVMIKAMQEQQDIITALKAENVRLRQQDASLDSRIRALEQRLQQ
jgi:hypothetical protein